MATKVTALAVQRNTAIRTGGLIEQPTIGMTAPDVPEGSWLFGFDPSDVRNEPLVFAADGEATREAGQHFERPFAIRTWAVKKIMLQSDESSEAQPHARVVLIDPDNETLAFVSLGIIGSLDLIRSLRGDGPYDPPIPVIVREVKTRHGYRIYKLRIVSPDGTKAPAK